MDIYQIIKTMIVLFSIILIGYYSNKKNLLDKPTNSKLASLVLNITLPALIINSVVTNEEALISKKEIIAIFFIGIVLYGFLIIISKLIIKILKFNDENGPIYELLLIFANTGFIGYPIIKVIFGDGSIFPFSILHLPFNVLLFSYGVYSIKNGKEKSKIKMKDIMNPGVIASIVAMFIFLFEVQLPEVFVSLSKILGDATTPLSMILIGSSLAFIPIKEIFTDKKIYIVTLIKLIILPIIIFLISKVIFTNELIIGFLILSVTLPAGSSIVMLTTQYESNEKVASLGVFISTLLSIITMPLITYLLIF